MIVRLEPERMRRTLRKNLTTSFGLTLAVGPPLPQPMLDRVVQLQNQIELLLPGRFRWYAPEHLHATVLALLRSRYREWPPLQCHELPADLDGFVETLNACFGELQPFPLDLDRLLVTPDGQVRVGGSDPGRVRQRFAERLASFPGLDRPKDADGWHITLGFLQMPAPAAEAEQANFEDSWAELRTCSLGTMLVDQVWLVHYADRTLSRIVGKTPLRLGRLDRLTADRFLSVLGIGPN